MSKRFIEAIFMLWDVLVEREYDKLLKLGWCKGNKDLKYWKGTFLDYLRVIGMVREIWILFFLVNCN